MTTEFADLDYFSKYKATEGVNFFKVDRIKIILKLLKYHQEILKQINFISTILNNKAQCKG